MNRSTDSLSDVDCLQLLLGRTSSVEFFAEIFERRPHLFTPAAIARDNEKLLSLEQLDELFSSVDLRYPQIELIENGLAIRPPTLASDVVDRLKLLEKVRGGASMRISDVQKLLPKLMLIARGLGLKLLGKVNVNVYVTPPSKQAFRPHFDHHDVFIVQCFGEKEWTINRTYEAQVELPNSQLFGSESDQTRQSDPTSEEHFLLSDGDVLYLPRGTLHYAKATNLGSVHLTIGYVPYTRAKLLRLAISRAERSQPDFRRAVLSDFARSPNDGSAQAIRTLNDLLARINLTEALGAARREIGASYPTPTGSMFRSIFAPVEIVETTKLAMRPNGAFTLLYDPGGAVVGLITQRAELTFEDSEKACFAKMSERGIFRPADVVEGDIGKCLVFIEQLLRHGAVSLALD